MTKAACGTAMVSLFVRHLRILNSDGWNLSDESDILPFNGDRNMKKHNSRAPFGRLLIAGLTVAVSLALAQTPAQTPSSGRSPVPNTQAAPAPNQLTPQVLGEMLRSAATFHELVENMKLSKSFGSDQHVQGPDGQFHHPLERTAQTIGAGAGAGAAIGAMTHSQNGVLIGALVGGAGGLIIDEILKHREELAERSTREATDPSSAPSDRPREFKQRDPQLN